LIITLIRKFISLAFICKIFKTIKTLLI